MNLDILFYITKNSFHQVEDQHQWDISKKNLALLLKDIYLMLFLLIQHLPRGFFVSFQCAKENLMFLMIGCNSFFSKDISTLNAQSFRVHLDWKDFDAKRKGKQNQDDTKRAKNASSQSDSDDYDDEFVDPKCIKSQHEDGDYQ